MNVMTIQTSTTGDQIASKSVEIIAPAPKVWAALTNPELMKKWMADPETEINIATDWIVGNPMIIHGTLHRIKFRNMGTVLQFEPERALTYTHLSSLSRLPDEPSSYSVMEFQLASIEDRTNLKLTLSNFPTESIFKHLVFYWNVTLELLKKMIETPE